MAGELTEKVEEAIANFRFGKDLLLNIVKEKREKAREKLVKELNIRHFRTEYEDTFRQIRKEAETKSHPLEPEFEKALELIAFVSVLRKAWQQKDELRGVAQWWLHIAWAVLEGNRPPDELERLFDNIHELPKMILDWQNAPETVSNFQKASSSRRAIVLRWLLEQGLVYRHSLRFSEEVKTLQFAKRLATQAYWAVGTAYDTLYPRFHEVYLSALVYANRPNLLNAFSREHKAEGGLFPYINRLQFSGSPKTAPNARKLQVIGSCHAALGNMQEAERAYVAAIAEYINTKPEPPYVSLCNSYVWLAAIRAYGKNPDDANNIMDKITTECFNATGKRVLETAEGLMRNIWYRIGSYILPWTASPKKIGPSRRS